MEPTTRSYIAGFLDGDGSIFFQLIRKHDYRFGFQIRASVAFYQKTDNARILQWLKDQLVSGSIRQRRTGISDYTIVGANEVRRVLTELEPYVVLKREHVSLGLEILGALPTADPLHFLMLCRRVDRFRDLNYSKTRTITSDVVERHFKLNGLLESRLGGEVAEPPPAVLTPWVRTTGDRLRSDQSEQSGP
ncbi:MAG TPA: LAGLIDADG family homing endonuclease [Steroidobacteraceae bacterium]|nr:LAGLIDADG family homing endonuclease [Steroidobacteraceae bacterium]